VPSTIETLRSVVLVHGAGSGPSVFDSWGNALSGLEVEAVDLHAGVDDVARATMGEYAAFVAARVSEARRPVALIGWSMGGLVAMLVTRSTKVDRLVLIEPSPPAEVQGADPHVASPRGTYDPEEVYGEFPPGITSRPESALARAERKRGITVPSLDCPTLVVSGGEFPRMRGHLIAETYGAEHLAFPDLDHWGLVLDPAVPSAVRRWLTEAV
jgi:pimeloyl-ACP methyl ester carboxylesterase